MAPSISGHGGEFELVGDDYVPTLDFTLPIPPVKVKFGKEFRDPIHKPRKPAWNDPLTGAAPQIKHPNDHETEEVRLQLVPVKNQPFDEAKGDFLIETQRGETSRIRTMKFVVRYYHESTSNDRIEIDGDAPNKPAVSFNFPAEAGFYIAVVLYDFRPVENDFPSGHRQIIFEIDGGPLKHDADRSCYLYITAAKATSNLANPQSPNHQKTTWPSASLTINANQLSAAMGAPNRPNRGENQILYAAEASQIDDSNLGFTNRLIKLKTMTTHEPRENGGDVFFHVTEETVASLDPAELPLGLYMVANPPSIEQTGASTPPGSISSPAARAPMNINSASLAALESLPGIGPVLAAHIDRYRRATPFSSIEEITEVHGIGAGIFAQIKDAITVD